MPRVTIPPITERPIEQVGPRRSRAEERFNSAIHFVALLAALAASPLMVIRVGQTGSNIQVAGAVVFMVSMALMYLSPTCYHWLAEGRAKATFKVIDHAAIFLLIAGTYTPVTLGVLQGPLGWGLLTIIWCLTVMGVTLKVFARLSRPGISTGLYLLMGWLVLVVIEPLYLNSSVAALSWLVAGGLSYTIGVFFYSTDHRVRFGHLIWHLFVMGGTGCHYMAILAYAK